jgi:hypothetical protein
MYNTINIDKNKMDICEKFASIDRDPIIDLEKKLIFAYHSAIRDLKSAEDDYARIYSDVRRIDRNTPYLHPRCEHASDRVNQAKGRLEEIMKDMIDVVSILGSYTRGDTGEKIHRYKLDIKNAKRRLRNTKKRALAENPNLSQSDIENLEVVKLETTRCNSITAELTPLITEYERRILMANEILKKYYQIVIIKEVLLKKCY